MSSAKRSGVAGVEDTLQNLWETRPVRPRAGRKIAGVSAAIGLRYGIDPILVRVAFVVGALYGGAGLVLYLLGWLLLPKEGDPMPGSAQPTRQPTGTAMAVLLVLLLIPSVFWLTSSRAIIGLALGLGALYLLHRNYGDRTAPPAPTPGPTSAPVVQQDANTWVYPGTTSAAEAPRQTPPSWDPLGVAPFAWDLPEPSEPEEEPAPRRPRRRWITFVTLGVAAFAAGLASVLGAPLEVSLAIALAVLGAGMVVGAFTRGGRGLIGAAIPVGALAVVLAVLPGTGFTGDFGDDEVRAAAPHEVAPHYQRSAGSITLDLRDLRIADGQEVRTGATVGIGAILVHVPSDVDITARCAAELGSVHCLSDSAEGRSVERSVVDQGDNGPGGGHIVLDLTVGTGDVEVVRD